MRSEERTGGEAHSSCLEAGKMRQQVQVEQREER